MTNDLDDHNDDDYHNGGLGLDEMEHLRDIQRENQWSILIGIEHLN